MSVHSHSLSTTTSTAPLPSVTPCTPGSTNTLLRPTPAAVPQDALERAYTADVAGERDQAVRVYGIALQAIQEGLGLPGFDVGSGV